MREVSPVKTVGIEGYYNPTDLARQMIFYGDITTFRTARVMIVAEESARRGRNVLLLTENQDVLSLAASGFAVYRPTVVGCDPKNDGPAIIDELFSGTNVVVCTDRMQQGPKNQLMRYLLDALALADIENLSMGYDVTESYHPRKRNHSDSNNIATLNNLLKRGKADGAEFFFGAESPDEIAKEISESCGVPIVGLVTNNSRAKKVSEIVDKRLYKYADEIFGIKAQNANDFYLWNGHTAARERAPQRELPLEIDLDIQMLTQHTVLPRWLSDMALACGYDPRDPKKTRSSDEAECQDAFLKAIQDARAEAEPIAAKLPASKQPTARASKPKVANDNARRQAKSVHRLSGKGAAVELLDGAGIKTPKRMFTLARTVLNARADGLYRPLDRRMTANSVASQVIASPLLRKVCADGFAYSQRLLRKKQKMCAVAYASAIYQAALENEDLAMAFNEEVAKSNLHSGKRTQRAFDLEAGLAAIGSDLEGSARGEAQFQLVLDTWRGYRAANFALPRAA